MKRPRLHCSWWVLSPPRLPPAGGLQAQCQERAFLASALCIASLVQSQRPEGAQGALRGRFGAASTVITSMRERASGEKGELGALPDSNEGNGRELRRWKVGSCSMPSCSTSVSAIPRAGCFSLNRLLTPTCLTSTKSLDAARGRL